MKMNHKVSISVREADGCATNILRGGEVKLRERLLRWLFGEKKKVLVIAPGDSVFDVEIREQNLGKLFDEYLTEALAVKPVDQESKPDYTEGGETI